MNTLFNKVLGENENCLLFLLKNQKNFLAKPIFTIDKYPRISELMQFKPVLLKSQLQGFPGGTVLKNPLANAGDTGSSPGPGRSHMLQNN